MNYYDKRASRKSAESVYIGGIVATEPLFNTTTDTRSQLPTRKDKQMAKNKKVEAEKLLADQMVRPTQRALAMK